MSQNARQRAIDGFRRGRYDILVATDVASRGIDVSDISHVINFDMPDTVDAYTHRIGRTGRAHKNGEAFTFMGHQDEPLVRQIEKLLGTSIERRRVDGFDYGSLEAERASNSSEGARKRKSGYRGSQGRGARNGGSRNGGSRNGSPQNRGSRNGGSQSGKSRSYNPNSRSARTRAQQRAQSSGAPRSR